MVFNNGYWLLKPGVGASFCAEVRDARFFPSRGNPLCAVLYAPSQKIIQRGQTLGGPVMEIHISSPRKDVLEISAHHFTGGLKRFPDFPVNNERCELEITDGEEIITVSSGKLVAAFNKTTFSIEYRYDGRFLTGSQPCQLAYMTTPEGAFMRERLTVSVGESLYGFGEKFTPFVKNGQSVDVWNEDGGTASDQAYKNVPFCLSSRGYGLFVNHPERVGFEVCTEAVSKMQFSVPGEALRYMVVGGESLKDVISNYTSLTGCPALPPAWSYGLWLSTSFTTDYDESTVSSFIDGMFERGIPLGVFHFDCFWMKEYEWCNFTWDEDMFPDPDGMLARLKSRGLKICVWINPYIGQKSPLFAEGAEKGYLIKTAEGGVWQWDLWQPGLAVVDFTNPGAVSWYQSHLRRLMSQGVDCFKTDFGERIPVDNVNYYDGSDPLRMHNFYTYLYNKAVFDVVKEVKGEGEAVLFARSATAGCQQFPVHWGGDCEATYESMAESLRGGLSLAACGFGFWSHDIGGFESTATPDLYKRWVAFGLLSTHSRLHGSKSYRVPWNFDEEASRVLKYFSELKYSLMPYIYAASVYSHITGVPVMRPMFLEFQDDAVCRVLDRQYMLGGNILVAPVFNPEGKTETYLPEGVWSHLLTGNTVEGGRFIRASYDYFGLPLFVRENSLIAMKGDNCDTYGAAYDYSKNPVIHAYAVSGAEAVLTDERGNEKYTVRVKKDGEGYLIKTKGCHNGFTVVFHDTAAARITVPAGCESTRFN